MNFRRRWRRRRRNFRGPGDGPRRTRGDSVGAAQVHGAGAKMAPPTPLCIYKRWRKVLYTLYINRSGKYEIKETFCTGKFILSGCFFSTVELLRLFESVQTGPKRGFSPKSQKFPGKAKFLSRKSLFFWEKLFFVSDFAVWFFLVTLVIMVIW